MSNKTKILSELSKIAMEAMSSFSGLKKEIETIVKLKVEKAINKMNLVRRDEFEGWCENIVSKIERVPGVPGLDITPEIYPHDPYFRARLGDGNLRYLCYK